ncbi:hypothetical protein ACFYY2_12045 [Streptomyces sp. NPDC001822]|uniref:hypothetical protein n=1 Tax=Streptomyces sp. NPDC001822 TaxID=3364614 RepID=UPI00368A6B4E
MPTVLIVTSREDVTADLVVRACDGVGSDVLVHRIDPADISKGSLHLKGIIKEGRTAFSLADSHRVTNSPDITAIWWRKPSVDETSEAVTQLYGMLRTLDHALWVNHPDANLSAGHKPVQLKAAAELGFKVPDCLITDNPEDAQEFIREHRGEVIVKPLRKGEFVPTQAVPADFRPDEPVFLQRRIIKTHDIRLTLVEQRGFPCRITTDTDALDWRVEQEKATYEPISVARPLMEKCQRYMKHFGLQYAAFDFAVDANGTAWFLECNPNGEWGFIESRTKMSISRAMAEHLIWSPIDRLAFDGKGGHQASSTHKARTL